MQVAGYWQIRLSVSRAASFPGGRCLVVVVLSILLCSCLANPLRWDPDVHVVQSGETLAVLALRYEVRVRDLAAWNRLDNPDRILPGQKLRVTRPAGWSEPRHPTSTASTGPSKPANIAPPKQWYWPAKGKLVPNRNNAGVGDGINVSATLDSPVFAASTGKVVYSGSGLAGYGKLIIIKHNERFLSAYGYNNALLVKEGETVRGGQRIASMGYGPDKVPMLHFEIRRDGKPVKPLSYLEKQ